LGRSDPRCTAKTLSQPPTISSQAKRSFSKGRGVNYRLNSHLFVIQSFYLKILVGFRTYFTIILKEKIQVTDAISNQPGKSLIKLIQFHKEVFFLPILA
jgi:hypothetical protein